MNWIAVTLEGNSESVHQEKCSDYHFFVLVSYSGFMYISVYCFFSLSSKASFWRIIFFLLGLGWEGGSGVISSSCQCSVPLSSAWCEGWCLKQHLLHQLLCDSPFAAALWHSELSSWRHFEVKSSDRSITFCGSLADLLNWRLLFPWTHSTSIVG